MMLPLCAFVEFGYAVCCHLRVLCWKVKLLLQSQDRVCLECILGVS